MGQDRQEDQQAPEMAEVGEKELMRNQDRELEGKQEGEKVLANRR